MKFYQQEYSPNGSKEYILEITLLEMAIGTSKEEDRVLFDECNGSNEISDKLKALETIVRRVEQDRPGKYESQ